MRSDAVVSPDDDRPRERLERIGAGGLADHELVALVLGQGSRHRSARELAVDVLESVGGAHGLGRTLFEELQRLRGVGPARAAQLVAAVELGRRTLQRPRSPGQAFVSPRAVAEHLMPRFGTRAVEHVGVALLDRRHRLLKVLALTIGTADGSPIHPREVFRAAVAAGAAGVIVFHNHPSGDPAPSAEDVQITRQLVLAGEVMGIELLDHLILADGRYYSFKEAGRGTS